MSYSPPRVVALMLAVVCTFVSMAAAHTTRTFESRYYTVITDTDARTADEIARYMDHVFAEYAKRLAAFKAKRDDTSTLYLFESERVYLSFLDKIGYDARNTSGVFFSRNGETGLATYVSGQQREHMLSTLRHEGFHQFAHSRIGKNLPIWVNEGLAEYFGHGIMVRGSLRVGFAPSAPLERVRLAVENDYWYSFPSLLSMTNKEWGNIVRTGGPNASLLYDQAWLMAHFLVHGESGKYAAAFEKYLKLVSDETDSLAAFKIAFGTDDPASFERAWLAWMQGIEPDAVSNAGERVVFMMHGLRTLTDLGVSVDSIAMLKDELRRRHFEIRTSSHGLERVMSSLDDTPFIPPGNRSRFEIVPAVKPGELPTLRLVGLELEVIGTWRTDPRGETSVRVSYR